MSQFKFRYELYFIQVTDSFTWSKGHPVIKPSTSINAQHSEAYITAFISFSHYAKHTPTAVGLVQRLLILSQQHSWSDSMLFNRVQTQHIATTLQRDQV